MLHPKAIYYNTWEKEEEKGEITESKIQVFGESF